MISFVSDASNGLHGVPVVKAPYRVFVGQKFDVSGSWWGKSCAKGDEGKTYNI